MISISLLAKGWVIPQCLAGWCMSIFIEISACLLLRSFQRGAEAWGGHSVTCGLLECCWSENNSKITAGFAPGFQQDDFRIPQTVPRLRQDPWEWEFAPGRVVFMDRTVQMQLLQSQKKWGKENFPVIGQVNAAFEGRIKSTVQGTFITLPCCRTTEMEKRQHSEDDNKDIMMGNTTLKCQWNGQF